MKRCKPLAHTDQSSTSCTVNVNDCWHGSGSGWHNTGLSKVVHRPDEPLCNASSCSDKPVAVATATITAIAHKRAVTCHYYLLHKLDKLWPVEDVVASHRLATAACGVPATSHTCHLHRRSQSLRCLRIESRSRLESRSTLPRPARCHPTATERPARLQRIHSPAQALYGRAIMNDMCAQGVHRLLWHIHAP